MNKNINEMTVIETINAIHKSEIKVKDIAVFYNKSERTIQKHIKNLGYIWNAKERTYNATGENYNVENDNKLFNDIINPSAINKLSRGEVKGRNNSTVKDNKNNTQKVPSRNHDSIDSILFGDSKNNNRVQRAYYLDKDIAAIIDNVDNKQKSNLINECLRKIFTEKGLL